MLVPDWITVILANAFTRHYYVAGGDLKPADSFPKSTADLFYFCLFCIICRWCCYT